MLKTRKMEGWGEGNEELDVVEVMEVVDSSPVDVKETVIEMELKSGLKEPSRAKKLISEGVRKAKFHFKNKGKLRVDEIKELRKTNKNVFDWMAEKKAITSAVNIDVEKLEDDEHNSTLLKALEKEERLERVRNRMKAWEASQVCNAMVESILTAVSRYRMVK